MKFDFEIIQDRREKQAPLAKMVSILIPTYERENLFVQSLVTAMCQSYDNLDIVVCDNASKDRTIDVALNVAGHDPRVRILRNKTNIGPVANFRLLHEVAIGSFVKYIMSDDIIAGNSVETLLSPLLEDDSIAISTSAYQLVDESNTILPPTDLNRVLTTSNTIFNSKSIGRSILVSNVNQIGHPSVFMYRKSALNNTPPGTYKGVNFYYMFDLATSFALMESGDVAYSPSFLSTYRQHSGSLGQQPKDQSIKVAEWLDLIQAAGSRYLVEKNDFLQAVMAVVQAAYFFLNSLPLTEETPKLSYVFSKAQRLLAEVGISLGEQLEELLQLSKSYFASNYPSLSENKPIFEFPASGLTFNVSDGRVYEIDNVRELVFINCSHTLSKGRISELQIELAKALLMDVTCAGIVGQKGISVFRKTALEATQVGLLANDEIAVSQLIERLTDRGYRVVTLPSRL